MKLTKNKLRQIIKEELKSVFEEETVKTAQGQILTPQEKALIEKGWGVSLGTGDVARGPYEEWLADSRRASTPQEALQTAAMKANEKLEELPEDPWVRSIALLLRQAMTPLKPSRTPVQVVGGPAEPEPDIMRQIVRGQQR